jgi:NADH-quinone oxidoreductase subunit E
MWRARYLEARVRHLEQRAAPAQIPIAHIETEAAPPAPSVAARKPPVLAAARNGAPDDLTLIEGVSALQQTTLNGIGVFHFDQIAAWTPENVAWVEQYFRLRGRITEEEWVEQAADLAREGPAAARRATEEAL